MPASFVFGDGAAWVVERPAFIWGGRNGLCAYDCHTIRVVAGLTDQLELETFIHEMIHAEFPAWDERRVCGMGAIAAAPIWASGARLTGEFCGVYEAGAAMNTVVGIAVAAGAAALSMTGARAGVGERWISGVRAMTNFLSYIGYRIDCDTSRERVGFKKGG